MTNSSNETFSHEDMTSGRYYHNDSESRLLSYEQPMPFAPYVQLSNGNKAMPQHYLSYQQDLNSVSYLLSQINGLDNMLLFADEDNQGLFIQVGMIGRENYDRNDQLRQEKLVYGRRWRIEENVPSSEIIQTAYLALQKVMEHEVRELFTLSPEHTTKTSTPFSTHLDLPTMANNSDLLLHSAKKKEKPSWSAVDLFNAVDKVSFGQRSIQVIDILPRANNIIVDIKLGKPPFIRQREKDLTLFDDLDITLLLDNFNPSTFYHRLMQALIEKGHTIIQESFTFQNFARFSETISPEMIANFSINSRPYAQHMKDKRFAKVFREMNFATDASKAPNLGDGVLAEKNRGKINSFKNLGGHLPKDF